MQRDELYDPLGLETSVAARSHANRRRRLVAVAACSLVVVTAVGYVIVANGRYHQGAASAVIVQASATPDISVKKHAATSPQEKLLPQATRGKEQIKTEHGVRVIMAGPGTAALGSIIHVPRQAGAVSQSFVDPRLVVKSRFGMLPKIGSDGSRPSEVYRRPIAVSGRLQFGAPRIALLITGMGLNESVTRSALRALPPEVSLGFAPLGPNLKAQAARAREEGHEILLQIPMEPLATGNSGRLPHELTSEANSAQNIENLRWLLGRLTDYFGIMNYLGAKLTSDGAALGPILQETADRGLAYVDDGTSPQSVAPAIALDMHIPVARADVVIDARNNPEAIADALNRLEAIARARGSALGVAAGLPSTIDSIALFARNLESDGFALVPASALLAEPPAISAASSQ